MDLSPGFKRILVFLYIRYLPGIFWDWFKGAIFAKNLQVHRLSALKCDEVGMRGIAAGKVKNNKGLREISLKFFNAGVKLHQ